jgi:hypothetical protein
MKNFAYFHWDGAKFQFRGHVQADDALLAFQAACKKLKLFHTGNIAVQETTDVHSQ